MRRLGWSTVLAAMCWASPAVAEPSASIQLFSHVNGVVSDDGTPSYFEVGEVDFFTTVNLGERTRILSENLLEASGHHGGGFGLMRLYLDHRFKQAFGLRVGAEHSPMGYYLQTFNHALLFQRATTRPQLAEFEHDGGMLPAHFTGVLAYGTIGGGGPAPVTWMTGLGNGRGAHSTEVQSTVDLNGFKAVVGRAFVEFSEIPGLQVGMSAWYDKLPHEAVHDAPGHSHDTAEESEDLSEWILGAHAVYRSYPVDVIAEAYLVRHKGSVTKDTFATVGGFVQAAYDLPTLSPYARFDLMFVNPDDPFFAQTSSVGRTEEITLGAGWQAHEKFVIKLEGRRHLTDAVHTLRLQLAFGT